MFDKTHRLFKELRKDPRNPEIHAQLQDHFRESPLAFIKEFLEAGSPILTEEHIQEDHHVSDSDSDLEVKIKGILNEYIRPAVEMDGGAISFDSFNEGKVKVLLQGACSGCPSSTLTLKAGIENLLRRMVPEVQEVIAEEV